MSVVFAAGLGAANFGTVPLLLFIVYLSLSRVRSDLLLAEALALSRLWPYVSNDKRIDSEGSKDLMVLRATDERHSHCILGILVLATQRSGYLVAVYL